jgi:signal transduction histidine kinase
MKLKPVVGIRTLYLRIWLTVIVTLGLFATVSGWVVQRHLDEERLHNQAAITERISAWGDLIQRSLPAASAPVDEQSQALKEWSQRLRVPMALDDGDGHRIAASDSFVRREADAATIRQPAYQIKLDDGRALWVMRPGMLKLPPPEGEPRSLTMNGGGTGPTAGEAAPAPPPGADGAADDTPPRRVVAIDVRGPLPPIPFLPLPRGVPPGISLTVLVLVLFLAVAAGAYPVVRRLTRRLETLQRGVEAFGAGALDRRVPEEGRDEVAAVARSFNQAASRIETLVRANRSLLANASHELRSPLARLKMATAMLSDTTSAEAREHLRGEIDTDIAELDTLVDEVLLASRLEASPPMPEQVEHVDLFALALEEGARVNATVDGAEALVPGEERLLRRALRNLLENARRYGGGEVHVELQCAPGRADRIEVQVRDNGPGVPEAFRERVFEPFFRLPGHAEREGGVGLGLALVKQIVERHRGGVRIDSPPGGGALFIITLPLASG